MAHVVPVRTCKLNPPRSVTTDETRESLTTWLETLRNFMGNDDQYVRFTLAGTTWDPDRADEHYGFAAEPQESKL